MDFYSKSESETINFGKEYAANLSGGEVFLLLGDLGGGKTQFVKGLAEGIGISEYITSPTFIYENIYNGKDLTLYHFDLYRSEVIDEDVRDLMLESFSDPKGVTVVEWAERAKKYWPKNATVIEFDWVAENERKIVIKSKIKRQMSK